MLQRRATDPSGQPLRGGAGDFVDIAALTPYQGKRWRLKARVTAKGDIKKFNGQRGPGQLFKIDIVDRSGGELSATFFGGSVDEYYPRMQPSKVYTFAGGLIKAGNPKWDKGPVQITFDQGTQIEEVEEDPAIPGVVYKFQTIEEIMALPDNSPVDVKAVLAEVRPVIAITLRATGEQKPKRDIVVWDNSGPERSLHIPITLWGDRATAEYATDVPVIVRGVRVREWNGSKSLSTNGNSVVSFEVPPDLQADAQDLVRSWAASGQPAAPARGGGDGKRVTIEELHAENVNLGHAPEPGQPLDGNGPAAAHRHTVVATITSVITERPPYYPACSQQVDDGRGKTRSCNKKLTDEGGEWRCMSGHCCQQPSYRYLLRARVSDHTGLLEISSFDEVGKKMFGCDADELAALWEDEGRSEELQRKLKRPNWQRCVLTVRSVREVWQDEERVKTSANDMRDEEWKKEARRRLNDIYATFGAPEGAVGSPVAGGA